MNVGGNVIDYLRDYFNNKIKVEDSIHKVMLHKFKEYLICSGVSIGVKAVSNPKFPIMESTSKNLIKLYYNDVGILSNILYKNNINAILNKDENINLGSVYETACAMELVAHGYDLYYFDSKKVGEVDFLINDYNSLSILPIEIKFGNDQYNFRAIPKLVDKSGNYKLKYGYVFENQNVFKVESDLIILPIYLIMFI